MKRQLIFYLLTFVFLSCGGKETENFETQNKKIEIPPQTKKIDPNNLIGFACYYSGKKSNPVKLFSKLIVDKNYSEIRKRLEDKKPAIKYLAIIVCKKLEEKGKVQLSEREQNLININIKSSEKITICSGCTNEEELSIEEMFTEGNFLKKQTESWMNEILK